ncbi:transketolase C-terminal domain-containing protein [Sinisalibacter aestuarii]|uniref:2-ketoisovalerate ferredoxin oxidoreductase subunit alpha n=1 Tax=Sinisalibacter aestuarii TaxID=2949426 RepID=A0ABQ5LWV7_9RHOB|nr:transketolase C-terminal domain-containing protein [Sinisalibacter aestuarii]GKY89453.1 2-ketoisovalerate ferredoxin oxidoreductase subunit alpha [Sinisalibacter aestuarii]
MREALEGSLAIARAVSMAKPDVVAAYPITPQTHIVENISKLVAEGDLHTEFVSVESEFSAASVVLGAAAAGARAYTASASQGILLMSEVMFNISGLRVPLVMTIANRAVGGPLNIWNDQSDTMAVRDAGWIQLHCISNQEAVDTTLQAFRIAQETDLPVAVNMDGFVLTHTMEVIDMPTQAEVDAFLPPFEFAGQLDPANPRSMGTLVDPNFFPEVRHSHHAAMGKALAKIEEIDAAFAKVFGRESGGLLTVEGDKKARVGILAMGSVVGTMLAGYEDFKDEVGPARIIKLRSFRPFPAKALRKAVKGLDKLVVIDRAISPGMGGVLGTEVSAVLSTMDKAPKVYNYALGLGGRDIPENMYRDLLKLVEDKKAPRFAVLDADLEKLAPEDR